MHSNNSFAPCHPKHLVGFYDLGLSEEAYRELQTEFSSPIFQFATFDYFTHPEYAWKPVMIAEVSHKVPTSHCLLWCDAQNHVSGPLDAVEATIRKQGFYSPISSGTVRQWTHPAMLKFMDIREFYSMLDAPQRDSAILGFDMSSPRTHELIQDFNRLAHIRACIAPVGSNSMNHAYEKALFSILYYTYIGGAHQVGINFNITTRNIAAHT
jgi:hypothetical protein